MLEDPKLQKTPLFQQHQKLGAGLAPFGGWLMPIQYQGILAEHAHTRQEASLFDICHMGEFMIKADPVSSGLDRLVTQEIVSMPFGSCRYGFLLNNEAGILDDLIVYRIGLSDWMVVVNAATVSGDFRHLKENLSGGSVLEDVSGRMAKLDLQGPRSREVLEGIVGARAGELKYYTFSEFKIFGSQSCIVSRTGYTGELGYEIYIAVNYAERLWETLLSGGIAKPAGLGCRDTLRLEMGYPLYGHDLDEKHTPLDAGLLKFVDFSKDFIGRDALEKEQREGARESLICFQADSRRSPRHGFTISDGGRPVGRVTSGSFSPSLGTGIGMGYAAGNYDPGALLSVGDGKLEIPVRVVKRPFLKKTSLNGIGVK
ncbi:MAG: glycine cleavage system aminomethyltransferase GcvT [Candidatus Omnitrophica bacterium]|nr:glycine cleavage system aminomethyltransferase GcvT [Candidatus Omnitrophota bacterium]